MRRTLIASLAFAWMFVAAARLPAQELKPAAVVLLPSYNSLQAHVAFAGQISDMPQLAPSFDALILGATQGRGLVGLDKTKPAGVAILADGGQHWVAFFGVTDLKALLVPPLAAKPIDRGNGIWQVTGPKGPVLITQRGGWAWISPSADLLAAAGDDPLKLLGGIENKYALGARINVQNVPADLRGTFLGIVRSRVEAGLERHEREDNASLELRKRIVERQLKMMERYGQELDQVIVGEAIDPKSGSLRVDLTFAALPGTTLAKVLAGEAAGQSAFSGFLMPGAAICLNSTSQFAGEDAQYVTDALHGVLTKANESIDKDQALPDDATRSALKQIAGELESAVESTTKAGKVDVGAVVKLEPGATAIAVGGFVQDPASLDAALRKLAEVEKSNPNFPAVQFDAETYRDVHFHHLVIPVPHDDGKKLFGDNLDMYIGIGANAAYVAVGKGSLDLVKQAIDRSAQTPASPAAPVQININATALAKFAAASSSDPAVTAMVATLAQFAGKDQLHVTAASSDNSITYRLTAEEGVLRALAETWKGHSAQRAADRATAPAR